MKIVHLTTVHQPFDVRIFHKEARSLVQAGYEVVLLVPASEDIGMVDGVRFIPLTRARGRWQRMLGSTWNVFREAQRQEAALYHFHDPELIPVGVALKMITRARVVYDIHEDYPQQILSKAWIPAWLRRPIAWGVAGLEALAARLFDGLVAATPTIAQRFPKNKTVVVRNFPRLDELTFNASALPYTRRLPRVVYIGGITAVRGAVEMVEAIAQVRDDVDFVLAGAFESEALQKRLAQLPGWERTHFVGWLNREQIVNLLGQSWIGLVLLAPLPRYQEAWPVKLFEYMAAGIPFVASDFPLWREIGEGAGLFVDPSNPEEIAQAIQWLLVHPQEAQAMGERGRELVQREYNWEQESKRLLRFYERLLA